MFLYWQKSIVTDYLHKSHIPYVSTSVLYSLYVQKINCQQQCSMMNFEHSKQLPILFFDLDQNIIFHRFHVIAYRIRCTFHRTWFTYIHTHNSLDSVVDSIYLPNHSISIFQITKPLYPNLKTQLPIPQRTNTLPLISFVE